MSQYIFGIHEPGGEQHMIAAGKPGWIVFTEALGTNPDDYSGRDYRQWSSQGLNIIARLNNGYHPVGTIPERKDYNNFAKRCANFVANSSGCGRFIIGNEMNHHQEWPYSNPILPGQYSACFNACCDAIHDVLPHAEVIIGAVAPWNVEVQYLDNESGDWIIYFEDILELCNGFGGIALHTYTHGVDPSLIQSDSKMNPPFDDRYFNFWAYKDFLRAILESKKHLPIYITETDQDLPWENKNRGWIKEAYKDINDWNNKPHTQKIHCLCLYRWPKIDQWYIEGKQGVIDDFKDALQNDYTLPSTLPPEPSQPSAMLVWPAQGPITQHWMENPKNYAKFLIPGHNGLDIAAPVGTPCAAVADGEVMWVDVGTNYGKYVRVWHPSLGIHSFYAHLHSFKVHKGMKVKAGQPIGTIGNTGNSTGPHLHLEFRAGKRDEYEDLGNGHGKGRMDPFPLLLVFAK